MSKKILVAAIVAALPLSASADMSNTLYGDIRLSTNSVDDDDAYSSRNTNFKNNASRLGFKGSVGKDGLKAIYHIQAGVNADGSGSALTSRFAFAGLKGGFGTVIYGRTSTPYKMAGVKLDPFYDTASINAGASDGYAGASYGLSGLTNGFTNNSLAYSTPNLGGFTLNASAYLDDSSENEADFNIGATYAAGAIKASLQYIDVNAPAGIANAGAVKDAIRLAGQYKGDKFTVGVSYEMVDATTGGTDVDYLYVPVTFMVSDKTKIAGSFGSVDDGAAEGTAFTLGVFHSILPKTTIYGLWSDHSADATGVSDRSVLSLGVSHKFSWGS